LSGGGAHNQQLAVLEPALVVWSISIRWKPWNRRIHLGQRSRLKAGTSLMSARRHCKPFFASTSFQIAVLAFAAWCLTCSPASAYTRKVYDGSYGSYVGNDLFYCDKYDSAFNYTFGRSEGKPVRGPNPMVGTAYYGSTDVDDLYDLIPVIHSYYMTKFGRNGPNGLGGIGDGIELPRDQYRILANANYFNESDAPFRTWAYISSGLNRLVVNCGSAHDPDLIGHEVGHIVADNLRYNPDGSSVMLTYSGESGALNEGLSDFYGEAFERYTTGTNDWVFTCGSPSRNLADPASLLGVFDGFPTTPYPDRYLSPNFYAGTEIDHGGIHFNSTVFSHGLYLASEGGSFNGFDITGIGFDMVEQIVYRAETTYFDSDETFNMAYADMILAATDLYGPTEVATITAALQAVEMNQTRVPEPSTIALLAVAAIGLFAYARRKRP
jgi:hypothetical protein